MSEQPGSSADDQTQTADEERAASLPDDSPLTPGLAAQVVDPATGESHTGQ